MILELDGRKADPVGTLTGQPSSSVQATLAQDSERRRLANLERLQHIIDRAQAGALPRDRELKDWEPQKLSPVHIQMVLDRTSGKQVQEIADEHGYDISRVSVILSHPDAQTIMSTVLSMTADRLTDVTARLKHLAPEALNVKVELMRQAATEQLRDKAASDILTMAGYGARKGIEVNLNDNRRQTLVLPAQAAKGLLDAMQMSREAASMEYTQHLAKDAGGESVAEHKQLSDGLEHGVGHFIAENGASPVSPSVPSETPDYTIEWSAEAELARLRAEREEADAEDERKALGRERVA